MNRANVARRIRDELQTTGHSAHEIATEIGKQLGERPRTAWRRAMGWSQSQLVEHYKAHNEGARLSISRVSAYEAWPYNGTKPPLKYLVGLAHTFGCLITDIIDTADREHFQPADQHWLAMMSSPQGDSSPETQAMDSRGLAAWHAGPDALEVVQAAVAQAVHETWRHLVVDAVTIEPMGIQVVQEQLAELSRAYASTAPALMLTRARQVRDTTFQMMERTRRPAQLVDLHLAAGMSIALLASASFDLGQRGAALAQIRAARQYADMAGHPSLLTWADGFAGLVAYWDGRPREAAQVIEEALPHAPAGTATARLQSIRARAYALLGDQRGATEAQDAADGALGTGQPDEMHDTVGGELGWERARHDMCAGTALITVGDARGAAVRLAAAVEHTGPTTFVDPARADLAAARLLDHDIDGTIEALAPVWAVSVERRRYGFISRLNQISAQLTDQGWEGHASARTLHDQVTEYVAEADSHRALLAAGSSD